ncbi:MAG TPA: hypothetical protein VJU78_11145 [Chitinophagaceae bacterium]|nr:hypothetical protein [Chitinophagaceae bacterium]
MITSHLSDDEVQQYALDTSNSEARIVEHVQLCKQCKARVADYQELFTNIALQPAPFFDFNLSELVMEKLPLRKPGVLSGSFLGYLLALSCIPLAGTILYIFRVYLISLFADISPLVIYLVVTTVITILIAVCFDMYKNYQKKMGAIDFY